MTTKFGLIASCLLAICLFVRAQSGPPMPPLPPWYGGGGSSSFSDPEPPGGGGGGTNYPGFTNNYIAFNYTNGFWLFITQETNLITLTLNGTEYPIQYQVLSKTNLNETLWKIEKEVEGAIYTNVTVTQIAATNREMLFFHAISTPSLLHVMFDQGYVNTNLATATVLGGPAASIGFVVNTNDFSQAVWLPYAEFLEVPLVGGDGVYEIWIGCAGLGFTNWTKSTVILDTQAPQITITNPVPGTVNSPLIQLQGYTHEALSGLTYDLTNAVGTLTNQPGFVMNQFFDTNLFRFTTNWFQCFDIALTNGSNSITLYATDLAGNTTSTNLLYVLDVSGDTNAPQISIAWPESGKAVSGTQFTLRGWLDDVTASISASVVSSTGETNSFSGSVNRYGEFKVAYLPLEPGTNVFEITARDHAGNTEIIYWDVVKSVAQAAVTPISGGQMHQPQSSMNGTVDDPNQIVTVNGVLATVSSNGQWTAVNVPISPGGASHVIVRIYPPGSNPAIDPPISQQEFSQPKPPVVRLMRFQGRRKVSVAYEGWCQGHYGKSYDTQEENLVWNGWSGGEWSYYRNVLDGDWVWQVDDYSEVLSTAFQVNWWEQSDWSVNTTPTCPPTGFISGSRKTQTQVGVDTSGGPQGMAGYLVQVRALEVNQLDIEAPRYWPGWTSEFSGDTPLPAQWLQVRGQTLTPNPTNSEWGEVILQLPTGPDLHDVTPSVTQFYKNKFHTIEMEVTKVGIELQWIADDDNFAIEDNNNPITGMLMRGGGKRIFVDAKTPSENEYRNTVKLKATISPARPNVRIYFRAFDVDDPSSNPVIDPNILQGDDNLSGSGQYGIFNATSLRDTHANTDQNGEVTVTFRVGTHPGDNYRVAASLNEADLNLQVNSPKHKGYVSGNDNPVTDFNGTVSPMLTVWRKLHLEVDSMEAVATSGDEKNFEEGTILTYIEDVPMAGQSTMKLSTTLQGGNNAYENGRIEIDGFASLTVSNNYHPLFLQNEVYVNGTPGTNVIGQTFKIYDDDDRFLSLIGLPPALPKDDESTNIIQGIRSVFFPAYIDVTNANAMGLNSNKRIPFKLNEPAVGFAFSSVFDDAKDLNDSVYFWTHTLTLGYQPEDYEDADPNIEDGGNPLRGATPKNFATGLSQGYSVVYVEASRDKAFFDLTDYQFSLPAFYPAARAICTNSFLGTVAHEIGHSPGGQSEGADHAELGMMVEGDEPLGNAAFAPATIKRFRNANKWKE